MRPILFCFSVLVTFSVFAQNRIDNAELEGEIVYFCTPCGCQFDDNFFDAGGICQGCNMPLHAAYEGVIKQAVPQKRVIVGLLIFEDADIMDVTGPWSVFSHSGFDVVTFAKEKDVISLSGGLTLKPDFTMESLPEVDVLVFPGSGLAETNPRDVQITTFIKERYERTSVMFSVCSGAFFLAEAGVLKGLEATTFASMIPMLSGYQGINVLNNVKYTDNGKVVTSGGLSSGIDASFHVVSKLRGAGFAQDVANTMEYPKNMKYDYARSQLADNFLTEIRSVARLFTKDFLDSKGDNNQWKYIFTLDENFSHGDMITAIGNEMRKNKNWVAKASGDNRLIGIVTHSSLGKAQISIVLTQDQMMLTAERLVKYNRPSPSY